MNNQYQIDIIFTYVNIPSYNFSYLYISSIYWYTQLEFIVLYTFKSLFSHIHIIPKRDITHPKCYIHVKLHQVLIKTNLRCLRNTGDVVNNLSATILRTNCDGTVSLHVGQRTVCIIHVGYQRSLH